MISNCPVTWGKTSISLPQIIELDEIVYSECSGGSITCVQCSIPADPYCYLCCSSVCTSPTALLTPKSHNQLFLQLPHLIKW